MTPPHDSTRERFMKLATINFNITKCPEAIYKEFIAFCAKESNDNYSFGLKLLLAAFKQNIKETILYEQLMLQEERIRILEEKLGLTPPPKPESTLPKTMGSGKKTDEKEVKANEQTR